MSTNKVALPPVPRDVPSDVKRFLTALRETVQIQHGMGRGSKLDKAITFRDLRHELGITSLKDLQTTNGDGGDTVFDDPQPTKPTGVKVIGMFTVIRCSYDRPAGDWYASTEVFRADMPDGENPVPPAFGDALFVGSAVNGYFVDSVPSGRTYVYWLRHVNRDGVAGPIHSAKGTQASTQRTPEDVLIEYSEEVLNGANVEWLRSEMGMMESINRSLQGAGFGNGGLGALVAKSGDVAELLAEQSLADALSKQTESWQVQAQFAKNYARLSGGIHAAVNADEAYVNRITQLESQWETELGTTIDSKIQEYDIALTGEDGAIAQSIRSYFVNLDGTDVNLETLAGVVANLDGVYAAQWGVKTKVADLQGGVGFYNDGAETSFVVDAQTFAVTGGSETLVPFVIKNGKTVMSTALIQDAAIYNLLAANVVAERIDVGVELTSPKIDGGTITGGELNINNKFIVDRLGNMVARNAYIEGEVVADSGRLSNVVIDETCEVNGTLSAANINGDIVDRVMVVVDADFEVGEYEQCVLIEGTITPGLLGAKYERALVVSGITFEHQNGGGSHSHLYCELYLNGTLVQQFYNRSVQEDGAVSCQLGCTIPISAASHTFKVIARPRGADKFLVQQSAIVADVFKVGETITNVKGIYKV